MNFIVEDKVKEFGIKVVGVIINNLDNKTITKEFKKYREDSIKELLDIYKDFDVKTDEILISFHKLHDNAGIPRRKNIPASENLIKLLLKNNGMPSINKVVDIYNIISMKSKLALGAHDIDKINGNVTLRITNGEERFVPLGFDEPKGIKAGEYAYVDDSNEIICRLEVKQVNKTKITEKAKNVFYIIQGNEATSEEYLHEIAKELIAVTTKYCGGEGKIFESN